MASKDRRLRRVDAKLPYSGGGDIIDGGGSVSAPAALPAPGAPLSFGFIGSAYILYSAVQTAAAVSVRWMQPAGYVPDGYVIQWATDSGFTSPTGVGRPRGASSAEIAGMPVSTTVYLRIAALFKGRQSPWSATISTTTPADTFPPGAPTTLVTSWSGLTGDLTIQWNNPVAAANLRDVRIRIYASNGGALLRETHRAAGPFVWTRAMQAADTSGAYDPSVYLVLSSRNWSNTYSSTDLTGTASLSAPAAPSGLAVDFSGPSCVITWTTGAVPGYRLTIDGVARDVGTTNRYVYSLAQNRQEHSGTPDPSLSVSLVGIDALGQVGTAAATTATNAAPSAPASVSLVAFPNMLAAVVTATEPADFATYRYRIIQTSPSASDVLFDSPKATEFPGITTNATYQIGVRVVDVFGQTSGQTLSSSVAADALTIAELRADVIYSDSDGTNPATLKALADDDTSTIVKTYPSGQWNWTRVQRPLLDRYRAVTIAITQTIRPVIGLSADGVTYTYYTGSTFSGGVWSPTAEGSLASAQAASPALPAGTWRVDLPAMVEARFVEFHHRRDAGLYSLIEFYPRRLVQSDDIQAEAVQAINIAAAAVTAAKISVAQLSAISADMGSITAGTMTGATVRTAASGQRVELTSANGVRGIDSGGNVQIQISPSDGKLSTAGGLITLATSDGLAINATSAYAQERAIRFVFGTEQTRHWRDGAFYTIEHEVTSLLPGYVAIVTKNTGDSATTNLIVSQNHSTYGDSVTIAGAGLRLGLGLGGGSVADGEIVVASHAAIGGGLNLGSSSGASDGQFFSQRSGSGTTDIETMLRLARTTTGTAAAGLGLNVQFQLESSTGDTRLTATIDALWRVATDASRAGEGRLYASDASARREAVRWSTNGSAPLLGFYGATAAAKPTVTGSRGGNAALASLLTALATVGIVTDSTSA